MSAPNSPADAADLLRRSDMILIERAVRNGWPMTPDKLAYEMSRLQTVIDDRSRSDRDRWRARRTLAVCQARVENRHNPNGRTLAGG